MTANFNILSPLAPNQMRSDRNHRYHNDGVKNHQFGWSLRLLLLVYKRKQRDFGAGRPVCISFWKHLKSMHFHSKRQSKSISLINMIKRCKYIEHLIRARLYFFFKGTFHAWYLQWVRRNRFRFIMDGIHCVPVSWCQQAQSASVESLCFNLL